MTKYPHPQHILHCDNPNHRNMLHHAKKFLAFVANTATERPEFL